MAQRWEENWTAVPGTSITGGQGRSFTAVRKNESSERVFIKQLKRPNDARARKRFAREVAAYRTLTHPSLPKIVEDNSSEWESSTPLYLVLEFIEGPTLQGSLENSGPMQLDVAVDCISRIADLLDACHAEDVVHRDLKPTNVILRDDNPAQPVVVDFGLSFNAHDEGLACDLTQVDEEVGNRFLRLPEQAQRVRSPVSDVTFIAGLLFYCITGVRPQVLEDHEGRMPHHRPTATDILRSTIAPPQRIPLMSVFDRAFSPRLASRYQSASDFSQAITAVLVAAESDISHSGLLEGLDDYIKNPQHVHLAQTANRLGALVSLATKTVSTLAESKGLHSSQTGQNIQSSAAVPFGETRLCLTLPSDTARIFTTFRFELRGPDDVVLLVDGAEKWRGTSTSDHHLLLVIQSAVITALIAKDGT